MVACGWGAGEIRRLSGGRSHVLTRSESLNKDPESCAPRGLTKPPDDLGDPRTAGHVLLSQVEHQRAAQGRMVLFYV